MPENLEQNSSDERRDNNPKKIPFAEFIEKVKISVGKELSEDEYEGRFKHLISSLQKGVSSSVSLTEDQAKFFEGAINSASLVSKGSEYSASEDIHHDMMIELALISAINSCKE